jgi:hypothetical protein
MTPRYCSKHGWHDGPCATGKRALTRHDFTTRIAGIEASLGDDETSQSNGYFRNMELRAELESLRVLVGKR